MMFENMEYDSLGSVRELQAALFPPIVTRTISSVVTETMTLGGLPLQPSRVNIDSPFQRSQSQPGERLKEPKQFFPATPLQAARWPIECQVIEERVQHIDYVPPSPEPYYEPTELEAQPQPVGAEDGMVVFEYHPISPVSYFTRSCVGGSRPTTPTMQPAQYEGLRFESRFESGNLGKAICITQTYYELHLRADLYTNRHQQWFYFMVANMKRNIPYRFSIVNLFKGESLYNEGMKPLLYSTRDAQLHSIGWRRYGHNISYYANECQENSGDQQITYTLTFTMEFPHDNDEVYLAHSYPYTYSDLQDYLMRIASHPIKSSYTTLRLLCRSIAGNNVYYLTVTAPPNILPTTETQQIPPPKSKKKAIVLTARVHPGETPASWMMKGMIDFLTGDSNQARELREKFIFKIIPMLNPDGVIVGNNRCSLTGRDLNRQYRTVIRETYPSVWHTKLMLRRLIEECGVAMYCDLHAHSRKHNVFIYGCESKRTAENRLQEQVFPLMLHKNSADKFSFENCKFRIQKTKEGTGRVVVWLLGVANSYTLEASFSGSTLGNRVQTHFTTQDLESVGRSFCETLLDFSDDHPSKERLRLKIVTRLMKGGSSADEPTNINLSDYSSDEGDTSSSDSEERLVLPDPCCVPLQAPPPSPMPSKRQTRKSKLNKASKTAKSPTVPRQILPVYRQTLDWPTTDPGSDFYDSADERLGFSPPSKHKGRRRTRYGDGFRSELEYHRMPPELMVIGEKRSCDRFNRPRSHSVTDLHVTEKHKKPWHRLRSLPSRNVRSQPEEIQVKLTSLRQRIWEGNNDDTNSPLSWGLGLSVLLATAYQNDCEELLRSCSQKLVALKKHDESTKKGHNANKKIKKKVKSIKNLKIPVVDESTTKVNANKKKVKLKRQKAINDAKFEIQTIKAPIGIMGPYVQPQPSTSKSLVPSKLKLKKTTLISQDRESESEEAIAKRALNKKKKKRKK